MPIPNYRRPQLTIAELLAQTNAAAVSRINPVVIAPQYRLSRYGVESSTPSYPFVADDNVIPFEYIDESGVKHAVPDTDIVDQAFTRLFVKDAELSLTTFATGDSQKLHVDSLLKSNTLRLSAGNFSGGTLATNLYGRAVQVGDIVYTDDDVSSVKRRIVTGLLGKPIAAKYGTNEDKDDGDFASSPNNTVSLSSSQIIASGTYTGTADTTYLVRVTKASTSTGVAGAEVQISDTAGLGAVQSDVALTDNVNVPLGDLGLSVKFTSTPSAISALHVGDVYYINAVAATTSTTEFNGILLNGPAVDVSVFTDAADPVGAEIRVGHTGEILKTADVSGEAWTTDTDGINATAFSVYVAERTSGHRWVPLVDGIGTVHTYWRSLIPPAQGESLIAISTDASAVGPVDLDNDLGFAVNRCQAGAQGRTVYALRVGGLEAADFNAAFAKISATDRVYALAVIETSTAVKAAAAAHVSAMSAKTVKNFRRAYVGTDSPGSYKVLEKNANNVNYTATISDFGGENVLVTTADTTANFLGLGLAAGDRFIVPGIDAEYAIDHVISNTELVLQSGPDAPLSPAQAFQIWKADTTTSQISYIGQVSAGLNNRRMVNVWTENGTAIINGVVTRIPNRFLAAEVAGLRCALFPQQGLTNTEISTITAAPAMFTRYTADELDALAAQGVFIITQEAEGGAVFIRHQLTTSTNSGALHYEDNPGVSLDVLAFAAKDLLSPYIGKKNVTPRTITEIRNRSIAMLDSYTQVPVDNVDVGPMLTGYSGLVVEADPVLKDRIIWYTRPEMPLPLNDMDATLDATVTI